MSVKLVTLPAIAGKGTLTLGGVPVRANQVIGTSDLGRLVYTPPADANDPGYASNHLQGERRDVGERGALQR